MKYIVLICFLLPIIGFSQNLEKAVKIEFKCESDKDSLKINCINIAFYVPGTNLPVLQENVSYFIDNNSSSIIFRYSKKQTGNLTLTIKYNYTSSISQAVSEGTSQIHIYKEVGKNETISSKFFLAFGINLQNISSNEKLVIKYKKINNRLVVQSVSIDKHINK